MPAKPGKGSLFHGKSILKKDASEDESSGPSRPRGAVHKTVLGADRAGSLAIKEKALERERLTGLHKRSLRAEARKRQRLTNLCLASFIILVLAVGLSYLAAVDSCKVETKLIFVSSDFKQPAAKTFARELEILQNSNVLLMLSQRLADGVKDCSANNNCTPAKGWNIEATSCEFGDSDKYALPDGLSSAPDFIRWISSNLTVDFKPTAGSATANLSLSGEDPAFLKTVLNGYVQCYADYRRALEEELSPPPPQAQPGGAYLDNIAAQLQKMDLQHRECDLALKLIDSRRGVFSGFVPDSQMDGIPSLSHFQKRIVELEISKRQLNVKFTSNSHEIKNLDHEIQQIRLAMRECLVEHMVFLQKNKELLLAQKQDLERKAQTGPKRTKQPCSGKTLNGDARFYVTQTLQVIQDKPVVYQEPIFAKASELKNSLFAFLSAPFNSAELRFLLRDESEPFSDRKVGLAENKTAISKLSGDHQRANLSEPMIVHSDCD
jgi:hypothetical protein